MSTPQPVVVHKRSTLEWGLDLAAVATAVGCIVVAAITYRVLPETIPTHFGPSGEPDGWGSKQFVWLLPILASLIVPLIIYLCDKPQRFNYLQPPKPEDAQRAYAQTRLVLRVLNLFVGGLLFLLTWEITHPGANLLGTWFFLIIVAVPILLVLRLIFRKN